MKHGEHHIHQRKRVHNYNEQFPHPNKYIRSLDNICLVFSVIMPLTAIPQIFKTFYYQDVSGVSLIMWVLYNITTIPFLVYGIVHRALPILVLNILWLIVQTIMIIGIVIYG